MYLMMCTRFDLAHRASLVSKYMSNAGRLHWEVVKWVFRYLMCTCSEDIVFSGSDTEMNVVSFVNSDYAGI